MYDIEIWRMILKNNGAPILCSFKLYASFYSHQWIQTGFTVRKRPLFVIRFYMDIIIIHALNPMLVWRFPVIKKDKMCNCPVKSRSILSSKHMKRHLGALRQTPKFRFWDAISYKILAVIKRSVLHSVHNYTLNIQIAMHNIRYLRNLWRHRH